MRIKRCVLFLILVSGCHAFDETLLYDVDPRLEGVVQRFHEEAAVHRRSFPHNNLVLRVAPGLLKRENRVAVHRSLKSEQIFIEIDSGTLANADHWYVEFIVFHEFGHAFLGRQHNDTYSIMNPSFRCLNGYRRDAAQRQLLLAELFESQ